MRCIIAASLLAVLSVSSLALAHGEGSTLMGTVTATSSGQITVRATDGDVVEDRCPRSAVNIPACTTLAGFEVSRTGRIWVSPHRRDDL